MPVAYYKTYCTMLDHARAGRFAFPAVNVTSLTTANAMLRGLAESKSDGIFTRVIPLSFSSDMRLRFFLSSLSRLYSEFLYHIFFPDGSQEARNT